jgi:hypothetical protein
MAARRRLAVAWSIAWLLVQAAIPASVSAHHSASIKRWDVDNDGVWEASDSIVAYSQGGVAWTTQKINRVTEAIQRWSSQTDWNPWFSSSPVSHKVWVDGSAPSGHSVCDVTWSQIDDVATTCNDMINKGSWIRIIDSDTFLDSTHTSFDWGTTSNSNYSGRGVVTHEIGHGAHLIDVNWANCDPFGELITMCGTAGGTQTWGLYTLTADDINSANDMYPP